MGFDALIVEGKGHLTIAQQRIGRLIQLEDAQRNVLHYSNDKLQAI